MNPIAPTLLRFVAEAVGESDLRVKTRIFVLGEGWQDSRPWPPPRATPRTLFLHSGGRANTVTGDGTLAPSAPDAHPDDTFVHDPADPAPSPAGNGPGATGAWFGDDGPARRGDVLCFSAAPLAHALELAGRVALRVFARADGVPFDLCARLVASGAHGGTRLLCEGAVRQTTATSDTIEIDLGVVAARLRPGERLRLEVAGAATPRFAPSERHGIPVRTTLHHDAQRPSALHFHALDF
jgi:putative CocE/NonD family hydrolase